MAPKAYSTKVSVSLPAGVAEQVRAHVGGRGVSAFVARALQRELEREQLRAFLAELDAKEGPVPARELARVRRAWPKR